MSAPEVDLDDTTGCPVSPVCEGSDCAAVEDLAVATAATTFGVLCITLCIDCVARPLPSFGLLDALTRAGRHAEHLGIDCDVAAAVLDAELSGRP